MRRLIFRAWLRDARHKVRRLTPFVAVGQRLLEIGSGPGSVVAALRQAGHAPTAVDVQDLSFAPHLRPRIYDGHTLPYADRAFDVALVLTVLHHAADPCRVVAEARRVATRVVVIEDVYRHLFQKHLTMLADSLVNLEFAGHPHHNHTEHYWRQLFAEAGLRVVHEESWRLAGLFRQTLFVLERAA